MNIRYFLYISLFLFAALTAGFAVYAADDEALLKQDHHVIQNIIKGIEDEYVPPDVENLSKLYWAIGKLDIEEDDLLDSYLMINECNLYLQNYHDDFEWKKIRKATREHILNNMNEFPTRLELIVPISLDRYDIENEVFELSSDSRIAGLRRLDFAMNNEAYKETCGRKGEIYEYPPNLIIVLNRPLVVEKVPMKPELAHLFLEDSKIAYDNLPLKLQVRKYERMAFLRLKVRITQYKNTLRVRGGELRAVVFGRLDGYEVYADEKKLKPLYYKDLREKRFRRLRKKSDGKVVGETP